MVRLTVLLALVGVVLSPLALRADNSVHGVYVEARTAEIFAGGCVMNSEAGTAGRQAVLAWKVSSGAFDGVPLNGLSIVAAVAADRNLGIHEIGGDKAVTKSALYIDARATAAQRAALISMAKTLSNGIVDTVVDVASEPIVFAEDGHRVRVAAKHVELDVNKHMHHDIGCGDTQWFHPLSAVKGATMGMTERHSFTGSALGTKWSDPNKRSAFFAAF